MIIGAGGREVSMAKKISSSLLLNKLYIVGSNPKIIGTCVDLTTNDEMLEFALTNDIELTIVGPEQPLENGIVDLFSERGLKIFGPTKQSAKIETDKAYAKKLMKKYNIKTAEYQIFNDFDESIKYECEFPIVVKFTGLAFGKGVVICNNLQEYEKACSDFLKLKIYGSGSIVVEEFLVGEEFSFICLAKGKKFTPFATARDYKRIFDCDLGANTGGMGMISPHPLIDEQDINKASEIIFETLKALDQEGVGYQGFLYAGLIKTDKGIYVIEFNARMGDPEGEILFNKMENDLLEQLLNCLNDDIFEIVNDDLIHMGVVASATGYPNKYLLNIDLSEIDFENCYLMNGKLDGDRLVSNGGRVLFYYEKGENIKACRESIYSRLSGASQDLFYRKDIGGNFESSCDNGFDK